MAETTKRKIRHALFTYGVPGGGQAVAFRGQTVDLLSEDVERGEKFDAFDSPGAEPELAGDLAPFPKDGTDAERDSWVANGTIKEVTDAVAADPDIAEAVLAAEQRRGESARKTLLAALSAQ